MRASQHLAIIVAIVASSALLLEGQHQPRGRSPAEASSALPSPVPGQPVAALPVAPGEHPAIQMPQTTRLQIDFFQVATQQAHLSKIDLDRISEAALSIDEIVKRLSDAGEARLVARLDDTVDLATRTTLTNGVRVPTVQDVSISAQGKATPSVTYQDVGVSAGISGDWMDGLSPQIARVQCRLEMSSVGQTSVAVSNGIQLPEFRHFNAEQQLILQSGKPSLILCNSQPPPSDKDAHCTATIVRVIAHRLVLAAPATEK